MGESLVAPVLGAGPPSATAGDATAAAAAAMGPVAPTAAAPGEIWDLGSCRRRVGVVGGLSIGAAVGVAGPWSTVGIEV